MTEKEPVDWEKVVEFLEPKPCLYTPHEPHPKQKAFLRTEVLECLFGGAAGGGKDFWVGTPILTSDGWSTMGDLRVGDLVFGEDGELVPVLAKSEVMQNPCYEIEMTDGEVVVAGEGHYWNVANEKERANYQRTNPSWKAKRRASRKARGRNASERALATGGRSKGTAEATSLNNSVRAEEARENEERPSIWSYTTKLTTKEVFELQESERKRVTIPNGATLNSEDGWKSEIPPYTLGVWLGDGTTVSGYICCAESDMPSMIRELENDGWENVRSASSSMPRKEGGEVVHLLTGKSSGGLSLLQCLNKEGKLYDKSVPAWVHNASLADKEAFVSGFFDTDGYVDANRGRIEFCLAREDMVRDVHSLLWSMGLSPTSVKHKKTTNQDPNFEGDAWRFELSQCPATLFRLPRKRDRLVVNVKLKTKVNHNEYRSIKSIKEVPTVDTQCIQVGNTSGLFRIGRTHLVTHNSDALLMAALQYCDVPGYSAMIFRNTFADLALPGAIMDRAREWLGEYPEVIWSKQSNMAIFPSGARLTFGYLDGPDDHLRYKGAEAQFLGFDEMTEIREQHYRYLISRLRKPNAGPLSRVPLRARGATNPAPNWVRRYFVEEGMEQKRLYVPCKFDENPFIDQKSYAESLDRLSAVDRARLKGGDWYAEETGNMFDRDDFQIIAPEDVPDSAFLNVVRYWDLAGSEPTDSNPDPDYTVGAKVAIVDGYMIILDIRRVRVNPAEVEKLVWQTAQEDGPNVRVRMEKDPGQAGKAQISHYGRNVLLGFDFDGNPPTADKGSRVALWSGKAKRGEIALVRGDWVTGFLDEAMAFDPLAGKKSKVHDDQMDACSGSFEILTGIKGKSKNRVRLIL